MANIFLCMTCKKECLGLVGLVLHKSVFHKYAAPKQNGHKGYWPKKGKKPSGQGNSLWFIEINKVGQP